MRRDANVGVLGDEESSPFTCRVILPDIPELSRSGITARDADYYVLPLP